MKYQKTNGRYLNECWRFQIAFAVSGKSLEMQSVELFLKNNAHGTWQRVGNSIWCNELQDAFQLRLLWDQHVNLIREAGRHPLALAGRSDECDHQKSS